MNTVTPQSWASQLLQSLGAPDTKQSETVVEEWETAEGGNWLNTAKYNPLNVSQQAPGATSINAAGVKAYTSWQQGLDATVQLLHNGLFQPVLDAFASGDPQAERTAIADSAWEGTDRVAYPDGLPTSSAAAAYAKAHSSSGGSGWSWNPIHDVGKAAGDVGSAVSGAVSDVTGAAGKAAGSAFGAVWSDAKPFILTMAFAGLGLTLIAVGGYQATKGRAGKAMQQLQVGPPAGGGSSGGSGPSSGAAGESAAAGGIPPEAALAAA